MAIQMRRGLRANLDTSKTVDLASKDDVAEKQDTLVIGSDGFINLD